MSALLVTGNVIWLQPTARNICTFAILFSHYCCRRALFCMDTVFYGRVSFWVEQRLSTVAQQTGHACPRSVKGDILVCMVSAIKLIPWNLSCMFCFPRPGQRMVSQSLWKVLLLLFCLLSSTFRLICLFADFNLLSDVQNPKIQIFSTLLAEKGTHLGH